MRQFIDGLQTGTGPFDFDTVINRRDTGCEKWERYAGKDVIPMWVADMDFTAPPAVLEVLQRQVAHGVLGYPVPVPELTEEVVAMLQRRFAWTVRPEWIVWLPGLVCGLNLACQAYTEPGECVATFTPVYPPFLSAPKYQNRKRIDVPLQYNGQAWRANVQAFDQALTDECRLLLLCHPQNPTGRDFTASELREIAEVCHKKDMVICSDEIHCDLLLTQREHVPTAGISEKIADRTVTLMAPSKTYNIPGLGCSFAIVSNARLRQRLKQTKRGIVPHVNALGLTAALAAYRHGEPWRRQLCAYLAENARLVHEFVQQQLPGCWMSPVEATYLAWINIEALNLDNPEVFFEQAGVGLMDGKHFGFPGFVRLNFGCPRSLLQEGLDRVTQAIS